MCMRIAILSCAIAMAIPVLAREKTDILIMNNGDRLTCEIKGLDSGTLSVNFDYISGTASVDWSKVDHLESKQLFLVKTQDGAVYRGTLRTVDSPAKRPIQIEISESPDHAVAIDQSKIIRMTETSATVWQRFNGQITSGIQYSKGNQATQYNLGVSLEYPSERWVAGGSYNSSLASSTGSTVSTRNALDLNAAAVASLGQLVLRGSRGFSSKLRTRNRSSDKSWGRHWTVFKEHKPDEHLGAGRPGLAEHAVFPIFGRARGAKRCRSLDSRSGEVFRLQQNKFDD